MTTPPRKIRDRHLNCAIYTSVLLLSVFEIADRSDVPEISDAYLFALRYPLRFRCIASLACLS